LQKHWPSAIRWLAEGQHFVPIIIGMVLTDLQGKGLCGKEAFLLKAFTHLLFVFVGVHELASVLVTFVATKVTAPAAIERTEY
jgi:hypothetical protein